MVPSVKVRTKRLIKFSGLAAAIVVLAWLAVAEGLKAHRSARTADAARATIAMLTVPPDADPSAVADTVRQFVTANSVHRMDDEFYGHWGDNEHIFRRLVRHHRGEDSPPHLECSSRSGLVEIMLRQLGYQTRGVVVYEPKNRFPSHTFLEFFNSTTGRWEAQDPTYDVHWIERSTGRRIGAHEIIASGLDEIVPCIAEKCGWNLRSAEGLRVDKTRSYLGLASIRDSAGGRRPLLVNQGRFPDTRLEAFCGAIAKDCRDQIVKYPGVRSPFDGG